MTFQEYPKRVLGRTVQTADEEARLRASVAAPVEDTRDVLDVDAELRGEVEPAPAPKPRGRKPRA